MVVKATAAGTVEVKGPVILTVIVFIVFIMLLTYVIAQVIQSVDHK